MTAPRGSPVRWMLLKMERYDLGKAMPLPGLQSPHLNSEVPHLQGLGRTWGEEGVGLQCLASYLAAVGTGLRDMQESPGPGHLVFCTGIPGCECGEEENKKLTLGIASSSKNFDLFLL